MKTQKRFFTKGMFLSVSLFILIALLGCKPEQQTAIVLEPTHTATPTPVESEVITETPASQEEEATPTVESPPNEPSTDTYVGINPTGQSITFWHSINGVRETALITIINEFNNSNEWGIRVDPTYQGENDELKDRMLSFMNTEEVPNLLIATETHAALYQLGDALVDINQFVNHQTWGLSETEILDFYPGLFDKGIFPYFNDSRLTFPLFGRMNVLFYNLDWLAELGFSGPPTTPESFMETACAATVQPFSGSTAVGRMGVQLNISPNTFIDWSLAFGGKLFDQGAKQYNFNRPPIISAMTFLQLLVERGCLSSEPINTGDPLAEGTTNDFSSGVVLFTVDSTDNIPEIRSNIQAEANFNWQIAALPHTTINPSANIQLTNASIPKTTPEEELAAWLFLKFLSNPDTQAKWVQETNALPIRESTTDLLDVYYAENPAAQMTLDLLNNSVHEPSLPGDAQVQTLALETLKAILNGADIPTTLSELTSNANRILEEQLALIPESPDPWAKVDPSGQTISFWHQQDQFRSSILKEMINEFNATNKWAITVVPVVHQTYGEIFQKLLPVLNTEEVPNLVLAYQHHAAAYHEAGGLLNLESLLESAIWGILSEDRRDFYTPILEQDRFHFFDGNRLGFPIQRSTDVLYYNADLLDELGYQEPPTTPDEFREMTCATKGLTKPSGETVTGYQFYIDATRFSSWMFAFGGEIFDMDRNQFLLNSSISSSTISFLQDLIESGCATTVTDRITSQTAFSEGSLLFMIDSSFHLPTISNLVENAADFNWAVAPFPSTSENPVQNLFGASVSIPVSTPEKELAAWLFIKYFSEPQIQAIWGKEAGYLPVRQKSEDFLLDFFKISPNYQVAFDLLPYGKTEPSLPGYDFVQQEMELALQAIFLAELEEEDDEIDVAGILDSLNATANQILIIHLER